MHVCLSVTPADSFLPRLKALAFLVGPHFPNPILETVQFEATEEGRGMLRATNGEDWAEVEVPLLKVMRPGAVQLPTFPVLRALANAAQEVEIEEIMHPLDGFAFMTDPKAPSREIVVRTPSGRGCHQSAVTLPTWTPDNFPALTPVEFARSIEIDTWKLRHLMMKPSPACAATVAAAGHRGSLRHDLEGHASEFGDGEALDGLSCESGGGDSGTCLATLCSGARGGLGLMPRPAATAVAHARRLLAEALPSRALKVLTSLLDTMEDAVLTLGFTATQGKFQVKRAGLTFVTRLIGYERFALQVADCSTKPQSITQQESTQERPPMEETDSLQLRFSQRTPTWGGHSKSAAGGGALEKCGTSTGPRGQ